METFSSSSNRAMLWTLLFEGGVFGGIPPEKVNNVKETLDAVVKEVFETKEPDEGLKELNKRVCQMMLVAAERMRDTYHSVSDTPPLVTAADISSQRQATFSNNLERKQNEFSQLIAGNQPPEINFADQPEEPLEGLDSALEALQVRRNFELKKAIGSQDKELGAAWIQGDNTGSGDQKALDKHINIGEETPLSSGNIHLIAQEKKVTFEDNIQPDIASDFLGKLKTSNELEGTDISSKDIQDIKHRLDVIEKGQTTILAMLSQILITK